MYLIRNANVIFYIQNSEKKSAHPNEINLVTSKKNYFKHTNYVISGLQMSILREWIY